MKIGIVGATGMVGRAFLQLMEERQFPVQTLKLYSSSKTAGRTASFRNRDLPLESLSDTSFQGLDLVFFSAGEEVSRPWALRASQAGALVIDNSSAFRMEQGTPLVVPEINLDQVKKNRIIANPNCSTIQLVLALYPLQLAFGLERVCVASYQSMSGAGQKTLQKLKTESLAVLQNRNSQEEGLAFNCLPRIGTITESGFSTEETKIMEETKKILNCPSLNITAMAVRVPTFNGHCEAVWVTLKKKVPLKEVKQAFQSQKSLQVLPEDQALPHQRFVDGRDDVYVGRLRPGGDERTWLMWVGADNLRKGAALNGLQIAEAVFKCQ